MHELVHFRFRPFLQQTLGSSFLVSVGGTGKIPGGNSIGQTDLPGQMDQKTLLSKLKEDCRYWTFKLSRFQQL